MDRTQTKKPPEPMLEVARLALREDIGRGDATSLSTVPEDTTARGRFLAKESLVVSGLEAARAVFFSMDERVRFESFAEEGERVEAGAIIAAIEGNARSILAAERVALNLLMRLSGVATLTGKYVEAVSGTDARITDTRKTTPGLRELEKAAVRAGGGVNHRSGLDDGVLIKDNHLAIAGGVSEAVRRAKESSPHLLKVEVEVESMDELEEAFRAKADAVLLDNMSPEEVGECVERARREAPDVTVEISGGVNLETIRAYAESDPDLISVGALTHSAPAADISLEMELC
ncbi:MAG: carboxylating nicotinate-nucleotide diphosphorylase [Actinomycetota bacterium]|jgi:nicotinate-nucleotide pyrophosphorylase (carboxylating)|nr:carboxylating nicotinate-nucleotide diphosphorylase [Actinomycetota bacterium]